MTGFNYGRLYMNRFISLISGSSGNATFISDGKTNILIDCGMSGVKLKEALKAIDVLPESLDALLITHEHSDHIRGAGVVSRRYDLPVYATIGTHAGMDIGNIEDRNIKFVKEDEEAEIGTISFTPFAIPHDAQQPVGFTFNVGGEKYSLATDIGQMTSGVLEHIRGSKKVILESNHDVQMLQYGSYPFPLKQRILSDRGHLSNEAAAKTALYLVQNGTEHIALGHLSEENNRPEIALLESHNLLTQSGVSVGDDMTLTVAHRYKPTVL